MRVMFAVAVCVVCLWAVQNTGNAEEGMANSWEEYAESYKKYVEEYKLWVSNRFDHFENTIAALEKENELLSKQILDAETSLMESSQQYELLRTKYNDFLKISDEFYEASRDNYEQMNQYVEGLERRSVITIYDQTIHWSFQDGSGNGYNWHIPIQTFEHYVKYNTNYDVRGLSNTETDEQYTVAKYEPFVKKRFGNVIGDVWENSATNADFVYNVWFIVNQLTAYSTDIGEYPRYAEETLGRGGGDCEDLAILIADLILSSKHTENWDVRFYLIDSENPENPREVNHVILYIDDGSGGYLLEPTATTWEGALQWNDYAIRGWEEQL